MRTEDLLEAIGGVDDELLQRSERVKIKKQNTWKKWIPMAACLCIIIGASLIVSIDALKMGSFNTGDAAAGGAADDYGAWVPDMESAENATEDVNMAGTSENKGTEYYMGNIYTLSMTEANEDITASRHVDIYISEEDARITTKVEDQYVITNASAADVELVLTYPYEADSSEIVPVFVDGEGNEIGVADSEFKVLVPANGEVTICGTHYKIVESSEKAVSYCVMSSQDSNLKITEATATIDRDGNVEAIELNPMEAYQFEAK